MSRTTIRSLVTSDGRRLRFRHWPAASELRGLIVGLHGIQSHSGWYEGSSRQLADAGFEVYFADRRGSGLNGRQRGHADHGVRLLNDVRQLVRLAHAEHTATRIPLALMGISWGGKTATAFALQYPDLVDQLLLLTPGLCPLIGPTFWQRTQLRFARRHDIRHREVEIPLRDPALFTDSLRWQEFIADDPLALHHVTSGFLNAGRDLDHRIATGGPLTPPAFLALAGRDQIIDNSATRDLVGRLSPPSLIVQEYESARHTLEFESNRRAVVDDIIRFLNWPGRPGRPGGRWRE
ncbi:MAG: lysophospholipase [Planctomycetaceae bacterium]|nr:lysophospholipase [Planctomycetaceae bacterium]